MHPAGEASKAIPDQTSSVSIDIWKRAEVAFGALEGDWAADFGGRCAQLCEADSRDGKSYLEGLTTLLMEAFSRTRDLEVYALLYELAHRQILLVILKRTRYAHPGIDPKDVLQDVFLSIYRYPHRFRNEKASSFRNWSFSIVRNTLLKHLRNVRRAELELDPLEEIVEDERVRGPLHDLEFDEESARATRSYALCLMAYSKAFKENLKDREKRALRLIEVKGLKYKKAADELGVRVENLKMIVCRARKKLLRKMSEMLEVEGTERSESNHTDSREQRDD